MTEVPTAIADDLLAAASEKLHIPYVPHGGGYGPTEGQTS